MGAYRPRCQLAAPSRVIKGLVRFSPVVIARPETPPLSYINHFLVIYPQGSCAVQIAPAICKKGREQDSLENRRNSFV